jgi:peptide-methionine (S)-S-oxide reductase
MTKTLEVATLGGGCFWCLEAVFESLRGVERVVSGFAGGASANPSYREVCGGDTGHAEVVQITFDPDALPYRRLLEVFFAFHDPTTPNRQGPDEGTQYRSIVLWHGPEQRETARSLIASLESERIWPDPIVTELEPYTGFHPAEAHHQGYYRSNPEQRYCQVMISPKLEKLRRYYAAQLKDGAATGA